MKFSEKWLREWVNPNRNTQQLADQLTMSGLEVDSVTPAAPEFSKVVVGEVVACAKHPDATRLHCCKVNVGKYAPEPLSIVCGGVNVREGIKVPVALIGAVLPGGLKIKKTKLRGELSEGMICSAKEIGLEQGDELTGGIMELKADAPVGTDIRHYFQLDDSVIEIELTPNRGDCLSIQGIARDVAALNQMTLKASEIPEVPATSAQMFPVRVEATKACPRYVGRVISGIDPQAVTPIWMLERLRRSGVRAIHPVVDICNYVMLELGQPMHAFDLEKLSGEISVRFAKEKEQITLLDGNNIQLQSGTLVIADQKQPQAIAGVMGGADSAVGEKTTTLFLESAYFDPIHVRQDVQRYKLLTESSYRFERGVDFHLQEQAIQRATNLILEILGGEAGTVIEVADKQSLPQIPKIQLRKDQVKRVLGIELENQQITQMLQSLGFTCDVIENIWQVKIPSFRFDINQEIDLIEELARVFGYENVPTRSMLIETRLPALKETMIPQSRIRLYLADHGYHEAINYSFVDESLFQLLDPTQKPITLTNPIASDLSVMRSNLWVGLLQALSRNLNRQIDRVRLFEMGLCFHYQQDGQLVQENKLAMLIAGSNAPEQWGIASRKVDFFDLKGDVMGLFALAGDPERFQWRCANHPALHPGQSAAIYQNSQIVGYLGALHPKIAQHLDLNELPYLFEIKVKVVEEAELPEYVTISKFPAIRRDIALVVDRDLPIETILASVRAHAGNLLCRAQLFDIYEGKGIQHDKKSVALGLIFQDPSRTLTDDEISAIIQDVVAKLKRELNAQLRT